jgi:phage terminase large subunit
VTPIVEVGGSVIYALQPRQLEAYRKTPLVAHGAYPTHHGYGGSAGGGKSYLARVVATSVALSWPGSTTILFRRTFPEIRDNHISKFRSEVPEYAGNHRLYAFNASDGIATWCNGSKTIFAYLERDDHVYRYQGAEYDCMIFEEATHQTWFQVSWLTANRLRASVPAARPFAMYLTNPGNRGHVWFRRLFVDRRYESSRGEQAADYTFTPARVQDNDALLDRDPGYLDRLERLPEPHRSWLLYGDFTAGAGSALIMSESRHIRTEPLVVPAHWRLFGAFDWGFAHPFSFGLYTADPEGGVYKIETITGRRLLDEEMADRITDRLSLLREGPLQRHTGKLTAIHAGHDAWHDIKARHESGPTTAEAFAHKGLPLTRATISRVSGLRNLRAYLHYDEAKGLAAKFQLLDTPGNRRCFDVLASMVADPDDLEDTLKVDADEYGEGGDDQYDETRYGLMSRPLIPKAAPKPTRPAAEHYDDKLEQIAAKAAKTLRRTRRVI